VATEVQLRAIMTRHPQLVARFYPFLLTGMRQFEITGRLREAAFIATIAHESGELQYTAEIWGPTHAQEGYEGRADLGNTIAGDGKRYRGRGLIGITGRANYQALSEALLIDYVAAPERLELPPDAALSACWWWETHGCNEVADRSDLEGVTRIVNGGLNGWESRNHYYKAALATLA
jgi:putative chitinase